MVKQMSKYDCRNRCFQFLTKDIRYKTEVIASHSLPQYFLAYTGRGNRRPHQKLFKAVLSAEAAR